MGTTLMTSTTLLVPQPPTYRRWQAPVPGFGYGNSKVVRLGHIPYANNIVGKFGGRAA